MDGVVAAGSPEQPNLLHRTATLNSPRVRHNRMTLETTLNRMAGVQEAGSLAAVVSLLALPPHRNRVTLSMAGSSARRSRTKEWRESI